jgi:hypothetical protein
LPWIEYDVSFLLSSLTRTKEEREKPPKTKSEKSRLASRCGR